MTELEVHSGEHLGLHKVLEHVAKDLFHKDKGTLEKADEDVAVSGRHASITFIQRTRESFRDKSPQIKDALRRTSSDIVEWMQKGGPWRAFLVTTVGLVLLLGLAGVGAFMLFFLVATANAIVIGFLGSVATVGAFTAFFFTSLIAIYIGALIVAVVTISTITFLCIGAALAAAGWIAFLWIVWQALKKGVDICKPSCFMPVTAFTREPSSVPITYEKLYD